MKTLIRVAFVAALTLLLSNAGYAAGQTAAAPSPSGAVPMVLAMEQPAVDASVSPGAGPETSSKPISRAKTEARLETTAPNPRITAEASSQGMPSERSVNAAFAEPGKHAEAAHPSYDELNRRIEALSKEIASLRTELKKLKSQESGMK